jgi:hypothetical protein
MQRRRRRSDEEGGSSSEEEYDSDQSYDPEEEEQPQAENVINEENQWQQEDDEGWDANAKEEDIDYVETIQEEKNSDADKARPSSAQRGARTARPPRGGGVQGAPRRPSSSMDNRPPLRGARKGRGRGRGRDFSKKTPDGTEQPATANTTTDESAKANIKRRKEKKKKDVTEGGEKIKDNRPQLKGAKMKGPKRPGKFDPNAPQNQQDQKPFNNKPRYDRKNQQQQQQFSKRYSVQRQQEFSEGQNGRKPRGDWNQEYTYNPEYAQQQQYLYAQQQYGVPYGMYDYSAYHTPSPPYVPPEFQNPQYYEDIGFYDGAKSKINGQLNVHAKEWVPPSKPEPVDESQEPQTE